MKTIIITLILSLYLSLPALAGPRYLFKIASIAPEGSVWVKRFRDFTREVKEKSNGEIGFKIYPGGIMGDDKSMLRKMRVGQLHGGGFTMTGIGEIIPDFRVMGIPFLFRSYQEVDHVHQGLRPHFDRLFTQRGLKLLALTEIGFIYTMSTESIDTLTGLQESRCWTPEGDPVSSSYLQTLGIAPTPLAIPDVLTSLQTGMVDTVFNSFYGSIVLQWFTRARYVADIPFGYAYGAFLVDQRQFARLPSPYQSLMQSAAKKHFGLLLADTRRSNKEAREVLQQNGVKMVQPQPGTHQQLLDLRDQTVRQITGRAFSKDILHSTMDLLDQFRQ